MNVLSAALGRRLARFLTQPRHVHGAAAPADLGRLKACLLPGDVLLVEGNSRISTAIKYLTQSTWSHAALYVRPLPVLGTWAGAPRCIVEADTVDGVRAVGLAAFSGLHVRVCQTGQLVQSGRRVCGGLRHFAHRPRLRLAQRDGFGALSDPDSAGALVVATAPAADGQRRTTAHDAADDIDEADVPF